MRCKSFRWNMISLLWAEHSCWTAQPDTMLTIGQQKNLKSTGRGARQKLWIKLASELLRKVSYLMDNKLTGCYQELGQLSHLSGGHCLTLKVPAQALRLTHLFLVWVKVFGLPVLCFPPLQISESLP